MRIQEMSDIHFELHADRGKSFIKSLSPENIDVLILSGDITSKHDASQIYKLADMYKKVLYVMGNHEFYNSNVNDTLNWFRSLSHPNLMCLDNDLVEINGQRFLGSTLWFKESNVLRTGINESRWSDFVAIGGLKPWVYEQNIKSSKWLQDNVKPKDIIITHHLPSIHCVPLKWRTNRNNCFFFSEQHCCGIPKYWFFGHTHDQVDMILGDTRCVCNPLGYASRNEGLDFDYYKVFEV